MDVLGWESKMKSVCISLGLLMAFSTVIFAEDHGLSLNENKKPWGYVLDSRVLSNGDIAILQRTPQLTRELVTKLFIYDSDFILLNERTLPSNAYFIKEVAGKIGIVFFEDNGKTALRVDKRSWVLPGNLLDMQTFYVDRRFIIVGILHKEGQKNIGVWELASNSILPLLAETFEGRVPPKDIMSNDGLVYIISKQGLYQLDVGGETPVLNLVLKNRYNRGSITSIGNLKIAALVKTKMFVSNEVELRSLPDGNLIEEFRYPHSIVSVSLAGTNSRNAVLLLKSKASLNKAEIILLNKSGHSVQRMKIDYNYNLVESARNDEIILISHEKLLKISINK